jgi:RNA polymerase sigma-70 factor (ECF subfamily)
MGTAASNDADLLLEVARGVPGSLHRIYARHRNKLASVSMRILQDSCEAEDVLHDVFVVVFLRAGQFDPARGSAIAWLTTLTRNLSLDRLRRTQRQRSVRQRFLRHEPKEEALTPEALTASASQRRRVRRALSGLREIERRALEATFFEGLSYPELAARTQLPLGTIKSRIHRGLCSMREALR